MAPSVGFTSVHRVSHLGVSGESLLCLQCSPTPTQFSHFSKDLREQLPLQKELIPLGLSTNFTHPATHGLPKVRVPQGKALLLCPLRGPGTRQAGGAEPHITHATLASRVSATARNNGKIQNPDETYIQRYWYFY